MTWVTWQQYRYQAAFAAALLAALAVVLLITGLHAAAVWHSALAHCATDNSCASLVGSNLSLGNPIISTVVVATSAVPVLPGLLWGAPMVASELETGTNQFAWTQSITRRRWLAVRAGWLLLAAAVLAGAVSAIDLVVRTVQRADGPRLPGQPVRRHRHRARRLRDLRDGPGHLRRHAAAPHPARAGHHPGRLRRRPGRHRTLAPPVLHDPGHRVLQAHGTIHARRVLPGGQPGRRRRERQARRARLRRSQLQRSAAPGCMHSRYAEQPESPGRPVLPGRARLPGFHVLPASQSASGPSRASRPASSWYSPPS